MIDSPYETKEKKDRTLDEVKKYLREHENMPIVEALYVHKTLGIADLPKEIKTYLKQKQNEVTPEIQKNYGEEIKKENYRDVFDKELNTGISINDENLIDLVELADKYEHEGKIKESKEILDDIGHKHTKMLRQIMKDRKDKYAKKPRISFSL